MQRLLAVLIFSVACGGICEPAEFAGTYRATFDEQSGGSCGPVPDTLVIITPGEPSAGCTGSTTSRSDDMCTWTGTTRCVDQGNETDTQSVAELTMAPGGDAAEGTMSIAIKDLSGATVCLSTYAITYARQ